MHKKIILLLSTILISLPLQACGHSQTSTKNEVAVETSNYDIEKGISDDLTSLISKGTNSIFPEVDFVNATISDQEIDVWVSLVYHEQVLNEFIFVRDTIKEYLAETDYKISSLDLCSKTYGSSDNLTYWHSNDMNTGSYRNGATDEMIMSCSLESLLFDDEDVVSTESDTSKSQPASSDIEKPAMSELFKSVYLPYATREESFDFNSVIDFVNATEYEIEITEPTSEDLAQIKVVDANKDYVYFAFTPRAIEAFNYTETFDFIFLVSYYQSVTNSEVSFENYSEKRLSIYDRFFTHLIGENEIEVSSPDEQISFLFSSDISDVTTGNTKQDFSKSQSDTTPADNFDTEENDSDFVDSKKDLVTSSDDVNDVANTENTGNGDNFNTYDNQEQQNTTEQYVLNTNTMKIHHPGCSSVPKIAPHNYATSNLSVAELEAQGYTTCGRCF